MPKPEVALAARAQLAEGPLWHPDEQALYWTDLTRGHLHRFDPASGSDQIVHRGRTLGCFGFRAGGGFVLGTDEGVFRLVGEGPPQPVQPFLRDDPQRRLNDGKVDPRGRFWIGSNRWDFATGTGALHVLAAAGALEARLERETLPNGLDWSPDGTTFYHADSYGEFLDAFEFDVETGTLGARRRVATQPVDKSAPVGVTAFDGLTVDAAGNVWAAVYGLGVVRCYSPAGELLEVVELPEPAPSSVAFGGRDLRTLFITTAGGDHGTGSIYAVGPGVAGKAPTFWRDTAE